MSQTQHIIRAVDEKRHFLASRHVDRSLVTSTVPMRCWRNFMKRRKISRVRIHWSIKQRIWSRVCAICGDRGHRRRGRDIQIDHIIPVWNGGPSDESNLQALCGLCNTQKGGRIMFPERLTATVEAALI